MKCAFAFFFIFGCEWIVGPKASKFTKETVAIQSEKKTGCDEYLVDQLKVASKNFAKYPFDDKDGKKYLEDICSMKAWSDKKNYFEFFFLA